MTTKKDGSQAGKGITVEDIQIDDSAFDEYDDEQAGKALEAIAASSRVKRIILEKDKSFIGRYSDGTRIRIPLRISLSVVNQLTEKSDDPVDQLSGLIETLSGKDEASTFVSQPVNESTALAIQYFKDLQKITNATMGE
jgi:hypothetical protein